jgi:glycosyltransferase involved in cell wall biosynthesis
MPRSVSPVRDLLALWRLYRIFLRERFDIVHSHTPKAGILGMLAAWAAGVPVRIHTFAGTATDDIPGLKWRVIRFTDRLTALFSTQCLAISRSLKDLLLERNVCPETKIEVLVSGSSNGIDLKRFSQTHEVKMRARRLREELRIPESDLVVLFVGRVVKDKGVSELLLAFRALESENTHLLLVGPKEDDLDPLPDWACEEIDRNPRIHAVGFQHDIEAYLECCNLLAVPTYREGFGNVFIQAAAMERPVVATRIPGVVDSVKEGVSGYLVPPKDHSSLAEIIKLLLSDRELRLQLGTSGRKWVEDNFDRNRIWEELERVYRQELALRGDTKAIGILSHFRRASDRQASKAGAQ